MASALRQVLDDPIGQPQRIPIYRNEPEFIDRINNPQNYPVIQNPDGSVSTHRMAAESDAQGNFYVFPTIQMEDGRLVEYEDNRQAMDAAFRSGNILRAPNMLSALRYAEGGYKQGTPLAEDQQAARRELENRGVDYKYGGDSVFGAFMPERRRILRPEQEQFVGYDSSGNAIIQNIPAEYGPSEYDPSFSPVVRGARSAGSFLRDIFLGDANEQSAAFGKAASALRGMGEGIADYAGGQARSALAGGVSFNQDTGQVDRFDPLVVMGGGGAPSGSLASGFGRSRSALDTSTAARMQRAFEDFDLRPAYHYTNALEDGGEFTQLKPSIDGKYGPGIYSSRNPEYGERYLKGQENARAIPIYIRGETARKEDWFDALNEAANDARDMRQMGIEMTSPEIRRMAQNLLRDKGYDSLEFDNEIVVFDPKNVRSVNAQFDPEQRESANILYSGGGRTGTGVAAGSALRQMNPNLDQSYEARMQRAQNLGFDTARTLYRGISGEYDPEKSGYYQFFTSSPQDAKEYGENVISAYARKSNNLSLDAGRSNFNDIPVEALPENVRKNLHYTLNEPNSRLRTDDIAHAAREAGYDSVTISNVFDKADNEIPTRPVSALNELDQDMSQFLDEVNASGIPDNTPSLNTLPESQRNYDPTTIDIIFDPKNIRSTEAEFDPIKSDSADLLSSRSKPMSALRGMA